MKTISLFITGALLAAPAFARIGENEAQIEKRYGKQVRTDAKALSYGTVKIYRVADLLVAVVFIDGVSESETFRKQKEFTKLDDAEVETILAAESNGKHWIETGNSLNKGWSLEGGSCTAYMGVMDGQLIIASQKCLNAIAAASKADARAKLKDF